MLSRWSRLLRVLADAESPTRLGYFDTDAVNDNRRNIINRKRRVSGALPWQICSYVSSLPLPASLFFSQFGFIPQLPADQVRYGVLLAMIAAAVV